MTTTPPRILVTRMSSPQEGEGSCALSAFLSEAGYQVLTLPLVKIESCSAVLLPLEEPFDWVFLTSANAARAFFRTAPKPGGAKIAAIGPATARAVEAAGYQVDFISPVHTGEAAATRFVQNHVRPGTRILWPCGNMVNPQTGDILADADALVIAQVVYTTELVTRLSEEERQLVAEPVDVVALSSPTAAVALAALLRTGELTWTGQPPAIACIGPTTARAARARLGRADIVASPHTLPDLGQAIHAYLTERPSSKNN